jgi:hypothetical protein
MYLLFLIAVVLGLIDGLIKLNNPVNKNYRESTNLFDAIFR